MDYFHECLQAQSEGDSHRQMQTQYSHARYCARSLKCSVRRTARQATRTAVTRRPVTNNRKLHSHLGHHQSENEYYPNQSDLMSTKHQGSKITARQITTFLTWECVSGVSLTMHTSQRRNKRNIYRNNANRHRD